MAVTYYVALPFTRTEDCAAPGAAQECPSEGAAIRRAEGMSRDPANAGAVAFKRTGDPNIGEFSDALVLKRFGEVPEDLKSYIGLVRAPGDRDQLFRLIASWPLPPPAKNGCLYRLVARSGPFAVHPATCERNDVCTAMIFAKNF